MKQPFFYLSLLFIVISSCQSKEDKQEGVFPVLSFIKSQVAHVDTSLYQIIKLTGADSTWDTVYLKREEFRAAAGDFLDLPDLTEKKYSGAYEESKFFDESLNRVSITYSPKNKTEEIQREELTIEPDQGSGDKVKTIFIDRLKTSKDSNIVKRLLWIVDNGFQVTTIIQKPNLPDSTQTIKVEWE